MEKLEELFEKIKNEKDERVNDILKNIIIINGAIVQEDNTEYKRNIYITLQEKYKEKLEDIKFEKVKDIVDVKVDKYIESRNKEINTELGNLKVALIRIAGIELYRNEKIDKLLNSIKNEIDAKQVYKLYEKIDEELIKHL